MSKPGLLGTGGDRPGISPLLVPGKRLGTDHGAKGLQDLARRRLRPDSSIMLLVEDGVRQDEVARGDVVPNPGDDARPPLVPTLGREVRAVLADGDDVEGRVRSARLTMRGDDLASLRSDHKSLHYLTSTPLSDEQLIP